MRPPRWLNLTITADDIVNGVRSDPLRCPLALAATRAYGSPMAVRYLPGRADIECSADVQYRLTRRAIRWARHFDAGKEMAPARFHLPLHFYISPFIHTSTSSSETQHGYFKIELGPSWKWGKGA